MDDYILYYYFSWFLCIFILFFMRQSLLNSLLLFTILLYISLSPYYVLVNSIHIAISYILLCMLTIILFGLSIFQLEMIIITFICMISYVGMLLWEKLVPVIFFIPSKLWIGIMIVSLLHILLRNFNEQIIIIIIAFTWGQLMYEIILIYYGLEAIIGSYEYMNYLLFTLIILITIKWFLQITKKIIHFFKTTFSYG